MPVGASALFSFSEVGRSFPCNTGVPTMVAGVDGVCDEDGVMPVATLATSAVLLFLLSLLLWLVPFGVSFLAFSSF